jgi:ACR3 family arsenite transporter
MVSREQLEKNQVLIYTLGLVVSTRVVLIWPEFSASLDQIISFVHTILMFDKMLAGPL